MVNVSSSIWIPLSNALFGYDKSSEISILGFDSIKSLGILASIFIIIVTFIASRGVDKITKITSIGGFAVTLLNLVLIFGGFFVLYKNNFEFKQPIENFIRDFSVSPNPSYKNYISILSFLTFSIFAFGGLEAIGGLVDKTKNPEKTFPKGLIISAFIISFGYSIGIFSCGMFTNWNEILLSQNVHMGNVTYIIMNNLGYEIGLSLGMNNSEALNLGIYFSRFVGLSMFLALIGAFFTLTYSPLKTLIEGAPKEIWPFKIGEIKNNMPINAMKVQALIVISIILLVSFGGSNGESFFNLLILMTNVAMTIPYLFLVLAFPSFKKKQLKDVNLKNSFVIYGSYSVSVVFTVVVSLVILFANIFSILEPFLSGRIIDSVFMVFGPILFSIIAIILYYNYQKKYN